MIVAPKPLYYPLLYHLKNFSIGIRITLNSRPYRWDFSYLQQVPLSLVQKTALALALDVLTGAVKPPAVKLLHTQHQ